MNKTILSVDDSDTIRSVLAMILKNFNFNPVMAKNGEEGLELFKNNEVDLIISDINMPVMDGITFIKEIRKIDKDIPILTLTTESDQNVRKQGTEAGANGWLVKPLDPAGLIETINMILE